jgi:thioredoxin reductase
VSVNGPTGGGGSNSGRDADVVVIGGGPGGYPAAIRAAQLGARVVCVENDNLGGTCLNWGCIPTKTMIGSVDALHTIRHAADFGLRADNPGVDFPKLMARKDKVVKTLVGGVGFLFKKHKVRHVEGTGSLVDDHTVEVKKPDGSTERITAENIVIATGSVPARVPIPGVGDADIFTANQEVKRRFAEGTLASGPIWTSNEAVSAKEIPGEMALIGGGVIGCEFGYTYNGLGTKCTILEMQPRLLPTMDADLGTELEKVLKKQGVVVNTSVKVTRVEDKDGRKAVYFTNGKVAEESVVLADVVLVAIGRTPFTEGLNPGSRGRHGRHADQQARDPGEPPDADQRPRHLRDRRCHRRRARARRDDGRAGRGRKHLRPRRRDHGLPGGPLVRVHRARGRQRRPDRAGGPRQRLSGQDRHLYRSATWARRWRSTSATGSSRSSPTTSTARSWACTSSARTPPT